MARLNIACICMVLRTVVLQENCVSLPQHPLVSLFPKHASDLIDIISITIFAKMLSQTYFECQ